MGNREKTIEKPLRYLKQVCLEEKKIPVGGSAIMQSAVDSLLTGSKEHGLLPEEINRLVQVICSKVLKDSKRKLLIRCLLPSSYVPVNAIIRCFSWMNSRKTTNSLKAMLLCWIVSVIELLDDLGPVQLLYDGVCFWMYSDALRQHASVLLTLITRKEDVRLYRIQRFLRLKSALGVDAHLNSVLSLYKDYCPHLIPMIIRYSSKGISPRPYLFWMNHIRAIQTRNTQMEGLIFNTYHNSRVFWDAQHDIGLRKLAVGKKRKLTAVFPEINDLMGPLSYSIQDAGTKDLVPLHSISSLDKLLDNIAKLELPNQAILVLKYPVLRNLISCYKDFEYLIRFKYRVHWILFDDLICGVPREEKDTELFLLKLIQFCEYLQEGHPAVEHFLERYLAFFWNGHDYSKLILSFIARLRLRSVEELKLILDPIKKVFTSSLLRFKLDMLNTLMKLLSNMMHVEYNRCQKIQRIATASSLPVAIDDTHSTSVYLFDDEIVDYDPVYTIVHLIEFLSELYVQSLITENGSMLLTHSALAFYQLAVKMLGDYNIPYVICPPPVVVYSALFSCDGVAVTRLCGLLVKCKEAVFNLKHMRKHMRYYQDLEDKSSAPVKLLNKYAVDVINSLWKDKAFVATASAHGSIFNLFQNAMADIDIPKMNSAFSVSKHLGLVGHALTFANMFAPSSADFRFTPHKMNKTKKHAYLEYLQSEGYENIALMIGAYLRP